MRSPSSRKQTMEMNIAFDKLVDAFGRYDREHCFLIDTHKQRLVSIKEEEVTAKMLEDERRYVLLPARKPSDEQDIMTLFVYEFAEAVSYERMEELHEAVEGNPMAFTRLLEDDPRMQERWHQFRESQVRNRLINWLCAEGIELPGQKLISDIRIRELTENEIQALPMEMRDFGPFACLRCHNKKGLKARFFSINASPENDLIERETKRIMKKRFNIASYGHFSGGEGELLTATRCLKCGSENAFWDY